MGEAAALLGKLAKIDDRSAAAVEIASWARAHELLLFVLDPQVGSLIPAAGFPKTLRGGPSWRTFLKAAGRPGRHVAEVDHPVGHVRPALASTSADGLALVFLGGNPDEAKVAALMDGAPLLAALLHAENARRSAEGDATVARAMGWRASELATALDTARSELERALDDLREQDRRKDEFLAMLGHELRNPMAAISGALEVMRLSDDVAQHRRARGILDRQATQLARLVDDLLDVSRVSQGKIVLRRQPADVGVVVQNALATTAELVRARKHTVRVEIEPHSWVDGDPARLEQMVTNLLTNAARYTDPGGTIQVRVRRTETEIVIAVEDNGIGIAPSLLGRVFEPFMQVAPSIDRRAGGLGIGLTLVKRLAELHQGRVEVKSEQGSGSTFSIHLPAIAPPTMTSAAPPTTTAAGPAKRILIVDDNVDSGEMLVEVVRTLGHDALHVGDGQAALEEAAKHPPDIVLLDIGLPGVDGYEVAARLRASPSTRAARIIAVSGYGQEDDRRKSRAAGCDDHLVKPVDVAKLVRAFAR